MVPTFPTTINGLYLYLSVALPYLGLHITRFGVDAAKVAAIMALYGSADTPETYLFYKALWDDESSKRTKIVKKCLRTFSDTLKTKLREVYNDIPASRWTDTDRAKFNRKTGLPHSTSSPTKEINDICLTDIEPRTNGVIHFYINSRNDGKRCAISEAADSLEITYCVVEGKRKIEEAMVDKVKKSCYSPDECILRQYFTTAQFKLNIDPHLSGYTLKCWVRWTLIRHPNLAGAWSGPHEVTIG